MVSGGCSLDDNRVHSSRDPKTEELSVAEVQEQRPSPSAHAGIRDVDFSNHIFPASPIYKKGDSTFSLTNGRYEGRIEPSTNEKYPVSLAYLAYGDVTADGLDDAMVVLFENVKGTALPYFVYVFTMKGTSPELLLALEMGDRVDGGLRRVFSEGGNLLVEEYFSPKKLGSSCPACATHFIRSSYRWRQKRFELIEKETLPNPAPNGSAYPIMDPYPL